MVFKNNRLPEKYTSLLTLVMIKKVLMALTIGLTMTPFSEIDARQGATTLHQTATSSTILSTSSKDKACTTKIMDSKWKSTEVSYCFVAIVGRFLLLSRNTLAYCGSVHY